MVLPLALMAGASLGASVLGAISGNKAANKAAAASQYATDQSIGLQRDQFNQVQTNLAPYMQGGQLAQGALLGRAGLGVPATAPTGFAPQTDTAGLGPTRAQRIAADESTGLYNSPGTTALPPGAASYAPPAAGGAEPGAYGDTANPGRYVDPGFKPADYTAPGGFSYGAADYQESPGLKFAIDRGVGAINSQAAHNGSMYSGAALKSVGQFVADTQLKDFQNERGFAQGAYTDQRNFDRANYLDNRDYGTAQYQDARNYGTQQYQDQRNYLTNRYDQQTGVLQNLTTIGANSASGVATAGMNYANNAGQALQNNAVSQGNAGLVKSSNFSNLLNQGVGALSYFAGAK